MNTFITLLLTISALPVIHDIQVAIFTIYNDSESLLIEAKIESADLQATLKQQSIPVTESDIADYIKDNILININNDNISLRTLEIKIHEKHTIVTSRLGHRSKSIESIKIQNTCLLSLEKQSNIIRIRLQDQERDFLMNRDRQTIQIKL